MTKLTILSRTFTITLLLIATIVGCQQQPQPLLPPAPAPAPVPAPHPAPALSPTLPPPMPGPAPPFKRDVVPIEAHYLPGEPVKVKLLLTKVSETIKLDRWPPEIQVTPRLNYDQVLVSVAAGTQPLDIKPGDTITWEFTWDQKDTGGKQVSPGWYDIAFKDINVIYGTDSRFRTSPTARVLIQYPQGALEKTIELNQSQTVNGITVTLERIELASSGMMVYTFGTLSGYTVPPGMSDTSQSMRRALAEYSIDGGIVKQAGPAEMQYLEKGTILSWSQLVDPVPSDAKELVFRISTITLSFAPDKPDELVVGPWEFKVPLE